MNYVNCALLVVVLILVIVCCIKKPSKEEFKSSTRNYTCTSTSKPLGDSNGTSIWTGSAGSWGSTYTNNSKWKSYRATRTVYCDAAMKKDAGAAAAAAACDKKRECVSTDVYRADRSALDAYTDGFVDGADVALGDGCTCNPGYWWRRTDWLHGEELVYKG